MCKAFGHKKHIDITRTVTDFYLKYDIMLLRHRCALFRNERSLSLAAACTAVCMLFAGCGDGDSSTAESKAAETSAQTDAASEAESAAPESEAPRARQRKAQPTMERLSVYVHEDDEAQHKLKVPAGNMYYRFWTASDDLESLFLTIFAISECEQTVVE